MATVRYVCFAVLEGDVEVMENAIVSAVEDAGGTVFPCSFAPDESTVVQGLPEDVEFAGLIDLSPYPDDYPES